MIARLLKGIVIALVFVQAIMSSGPALAAGIGVSPKAFSVYQPTGEETQTGLSLHNTGETPALYEVYADNYDQLILVDAETIRLAPGEGRWIPMTINSFPPGSYETAISVVASEISEEELPKTGVKIPITIESQVNEATIGGSSLNTWVLLLLVFAFILFLFALYRQSQKSRFAKTVDAVQETWSDGNLERTAKHYRKKHPLMLISILAILLASGLLVWSFLASSQEVNTEQVQDQVERYQVVLQTPDESRVFTISSQIAVSPFHALERLRDEYEIPLAYDPPTELGVFVTMIDGYTNGEDGNYWVYEINNERIPVAADRVQLEPNDQLVWKFVVPSSE